MAVIMTTTPATRTSVSSRTGRVNRPASRDKLEETDGSETRSLLVRGDVGPLRDVVEVPAVIVERLEQHLAVGQRRLPVERRLDLRRVEAERLRDHPVLIRPER